MMTTKQNLTAKVKIIHAHLPGLLLSYFQHTRVFKQTYLHSSKSDSWATRRSSCSPRFCFNFLVSLCPLDVIFLKYIFSPSIFKICCSLLMLSTIFLINPIHSKSKSAVYGVTLKHQSADYLRTGSQTTTTEPSMDHSQNKIK